MVAVVAVAMSPAIVGALHDMQEAEHRECRDNQWLLGLHLGNPGNHCYANAAVCAMFDMPPALRYASGA